MQQEHAWGLNDSSHWTEKQPLALGMQLQTLPFRQGQFLVLASLFELLCWYRLAAKAVLAAARESKDLTILVNWYWNGFAR